MNCQHKTWYERKLIKSKDLDELEQKRNELASDGWSVDDWSDVQEVDDTIIGNVWVFEAWRERCSCSRRRKKA